MRSNVLLLAVATALFGLVSAPAVADKSVFIDLVYPPEDSAPASSVPEQPDCTVAVSVADQRDEDSRLGRGKLIGVIEKRDVRLLTDNDIVAWVQSAYANELRAAGHAVVQLDRDITVDGALSLRVELNAVELDCGIACTGKVELRSTLTTDEKITVTTKAEEGGFTVLLRRYSKPGQKALAKALKSAVQRTLSDLGLSGAEKVCSEL